MSNLSKAEKRVLGKILAKARAAKKRKANAIRNPARRVRK